MTTPIAEESVGPLRHPCDLDVLLFFHRFPRVLLTSERLAQYVGYDMKKVGKSLEILIAARLITRSLNPSNDARFYVLTADHSLEWLHALLSAASSPNGRARLVRMLKESGQRGRPNVAGKGGRPSGGSYAAKEGQEVI